MKNPLLEASGLPRFDLIEPEHVEPALRELLAQLSSELGALEREAAPSWQALVEPLERTGDRLDRTWGVVGHLMAVRNSEALRRAHERVQPEVVDFSVRLAQSRPIYEALKALKAGKAFEELDLAQQRIVHLLLRDAELTGVGLEGAARERFNAIQTELAELGTRFGNHVLDATKAFALTLRASPSRHALRRSDQPWMPHRRPSGQQPGGLVPFMMKRKVLQTMARQQDDQFCKCHTGYGVIGRTSRCGCVRGRDGHGWICPRYPLPALSSRRNGGCRLSYTSLLLKTAAH